MISSFVHQPCEVQLHLYSSDIFIHPPRPNSELPGDDQTLRGLVEIRVPSERTIQGVKVTLQGNQTLAIPERIPDTNIIQTRYEDRVVLDKVVEITSDALKPSGSSNHRGRGKGKERQHIDNAIGAASVQPEAHAVASSSPSDSAAMGHGIHLEKGVHGFEFAFIIPASSAPFERGKHGRVRYTLTATALGAGRGRANVSTNREILIILQVNADGGPVPLDIQYHDVHEALGAMSISLTSANLTVGGAATLSIYHPSPPPGLSVHLIRVFLEQTVELYSEVRKAWMKLPLEKLRIWERGYMPYKDASKQIDPSATMEDSFWLRNEQDPTLPGRPGTAVLSGGFGAPTLAPYGATMHPGYTGSLGSSQFTSPLHSHPPTPGAGLPGTPGAHLTNGGGGGEGYKAKAVMRLPDDDHIRPSTVRGSRAEIRISHELGVEVFFSRANVLDERAHSETFGKPKVQVFSMRRATIIPSCCATYDTIHLPPYSLESPMSSRPPSPTRGRNTASHPPSRNASQSELDHWRLTQTLKAALGGHANSGSPAATGSNGIQSAERSQPGSSAASRSTSPSRHPTNQVNNSNNNNNNNSHQHHTSALSSTFGYFSNHHGRRSRPASPTREGGGGGMSITSTGSAPQSPGLMPIAAARKMGGNAGSSNLHALTPSNKPVSVLGGGGSSSHSTTFPTVTTAPASGTSTPRTLPANSPWATNNFPVRTSTSHDACQCGRTTEELMEAEQRVLEGAPTAPGVWIDAHDEGQLPPPWTPSRPSSPTMMMLTDSADENGRRQQQDVSGWYRGDDGTREGGRARGKIGEMIGSLSVNEGESNSGQRRHAVEEHDSDDDGGHL